MTSPLPLALQAGEGAFVAFANVQVYIKAGSDATNGRFSVLEYTAPAGFAGPALHYHRSMEEIFYVLEGTVTFRIGDEQIEARGGAAVYVPAGTVHTFSNLSDTPARMLIVDMPGGFEGYFDELKQLMDVEPTWPPSDRRKMWQLLEKYDTFPAESEGCLKRFIKVDKGV